MEVRNNTNNADKCQCPERIRTRGPGI